MSGCAGAGQGCSRPLWCGIQGGPTMPANVESSPDVVMVQTHEELIKMVEQVRAATGSEDGRGETSGFSPCFTHTSVLLLSCQIREELDGDGERAIAIDLEAHSIRSFQVRTGPGMAPSSHRPLLAL